jgi:hypothetical protein
VLLLDAVLNLFIFPVRYQSFIPSGCVFLLALALPRRGLCFAVIMCYITIAQKAGNMKLTRTGNREKVQASFCATIAGSFFIMETK